MKELTSIVFVWFYSLGTTFMGWKCEGLRGSEPQPLYNVENMMFNSFLWYCLSTNFRKSSIFDSSLKYFPNKLAYMEYLYPSMS